MSSDDFPQLYGCYVIYSVIAPDNSQQSTYDSSSFYVMIKNILTRRKESDTYLATVSRHRKSSHIADLPLQLMKAIVLAESYTFYLISSPSANSNDVY